MFDRIFGEYLVEKGALKQSQLDVISQDENHTRVKLGVIAVAEKLMSEAQADEVNQLQAITDRRFGDIAIEKGYLNEQQLQSLLKQQGNSFLHFVQSAIDNGFANLDMIDEYLDSYQDEMGYTHSDMDDLVSGDIDREINVMLPHIDPLYQRLCGVAIRSIIRLISTDTYIGRAYAATEVKVDRFACQESFGDHDVVAGFAGMGDGLLAVAESFADEKFPEVDLDALDSVGEFVNIIDGLFAVDLGNEDVDVDMRPPSFYDSPVTIKGEKLCVVPVKVDGRDIQFIMSIDSKYEVE